MLWYGTLQQTFHVMAAVDIAEDTRKKNGKIKVHEECLCTIKLYPNGLMEMTPGFSEDIGEDDEVENVWRSDYSVAVQSEKGSRLSTNKFVSPRGDVYEYTIENVLECIDVEEIERKIIEQRWVS